MLPFMKSESELQEVSYPRERPPTIEGTHNSPLETLEQVVAKDGEIPGPTHESTPPEAPKEDVVLADGSEDFDFSALVIPGGKLGSMLGLTSSATVFDINDGIKKFVQDRETEKVMTMVDGVAQERKNVFESAIKERQFLNFVLVLFLILIGRFGSNFIIGDIYNNITVGDVNTMVMNATRFSLDPQLATRWDTNVTEYYLNLSYLSGSMFGEGINILVGLVGVFLLIPLLEALIKKTSPLRGLGVFVLRLFKIPYIQFVFASIFLFLMNLGFYISFLYFSWQAVIAFRILFGIADAFHRYLSFLFITKQFYQQHLFLSIGIYLTTDALVQIFSSTLREIVSIKLLDIMLVSNIICAISTISTIALPYLDFEKNSIFNSVIKTRPRDPKEKGYWSKWISIPTIPTHLILIFFFSIAIGFLEILTTEWKYSPIWERTARVMQVMIYSISLPAIGSLLDIESVRKKYLPTAPYGRIIYNSFWEYKWHFIIFYIGIAGVTIVSSILTFVEMRYFQALLFLSGLQGVFLACIHMSLFAMPMGYIRNINFRYKSLLYPAYMNLTHLVASFAAFVKFWLFTSTNLSSLVPGIYAICIGMLDLISILLLIPILTIITGYWIHDRIQPYVLSKETEKLKKDDDYISPSRRPWWRLIYLIPTEFFVMTLSFSILFTACGGLNILLHSLYSTNSTSNVPNIIFLPILFLFTLISGYFTFPNEIFRLVNAVFFGKSRRIIFGVPKPTIGSMLATNPAFCMAHDLIKKKEKVYKGLWSGRLLPKVVVTVIPDDIILEKEDDRILVTEMSDKHSNHQDGVDVIKCSNGIILLDMERVKKLNLINFDKQEIAKIQSIKFKGRWVNSDWFYVHFHLFAYIGYFAFFLIPLVYKLILKALCTGVLCKNIVIFEDSIQGVILAIDFIFGFFLMIPFVEIYREVCRNLERMLHHIIFLKNLSNTTLTCKSTEDHENFSNEILRILDIYTNHAQGMVTSRGEYLKYTILFAMGVSKIFSVTFSMFALFVKGFVTVDIMHIVFLIIVIELFVARFIILPAAVITGEFRGLLVVSLTKEKAFKKYISSVPVDPKCRLVADYWHAIRINWGPLINIGNIGFNIRVNFLATRWWFGSSVMRNWVFSFLFSVIPSIITYFVKQI